MSAKRIRHNQNHWQQLIESQAHSGLSGARFCREHNVAYASFLAWRKRLQESAVQPSCASEKTFIELTASSSVPDISQAEPESESSVCVELTLGAGIELRITRSV